MARITDAYREHPVWSHPGIEAYVKQQWVVGMPAREMANEIRRRTRQHCSPDMVTSKAKRMGLPKRENPVGTNQHHKKSAIQRNSTGRGWAPTNERVSECAWPLNDGRPWKFCGCPTLPGDPYCYAHRQLALPADKKDKATS